MARRAGAGSWIARLLLFVIVVGLVAYTVIQLPYGNAETEKPLVYDHDGYEGRPDSPLNPDQVQSLQQRVRSQGF